MSSLSTSSKTSVTLFINEAIKTKLDLIADIENLPKETVLEKLIMNYTPVPAEVKPGEFRAMYMSHVTRLRKIKPQAITVLIPHTPKHDQAVPFNKLAIPYKVYKDYWEGRITWDEYKRQFIERWMLPDAQAEIARLRKLRETQDVYIVGFERDEEHSIRKMFVDFLNGKLVWK